jgi:serine O-acetyltransferase
MNLSEQQTMKKQTHTFINNYNFKERLKGDLFAWLKIWHTGWTPEQGLIWKDVIWLIWNSLGLRATLLYRLSYHLRYKRVKLLPGILSRLNITLHGFDVPSSVDIGPGLYVPHPVGTVVMARQIGANLSLIGSNTIGMRNTWAFPILGNNVFMGAGARVLGEIVIGDNVTIGANAVVIKDVPSNCTAVGVPAKVLANSKNIDIEKDLKTIDN